MPSADESEDGRSELDREDEGHVADQSHDPLIAGTFISFLASSWRLIRLRFGKVFLSFIIGNLLVYALLLTISRTAGTDTAAVGVVFFTGQFLLTAVIGGLLTAAAGYVRVEALRSQPLTVLQGVRRVGGVWGHLASACLFTGMVAAMMLLGLGLIGLFLALPFRLGPPILLFVIAFEKFNLSGGWVRARELIRRNALRTFVYLLMLALMAMVVLLVLQRLLQMSLGTMELSNVGDALVFTGVTVILYGLLDTALSAGLLVAYTDCRGRNEEDFTVTDLAVDDEDEDDEE